MRMWLNDFSLKKIIFIGMFFLFSTIKAQEKNNDIIIKNQKNAQNREILRAIPEDDLIVYSADDEKYIVTIFTDVFCTYCRRLHDNIHDFLINKITVRYAPFPITPSSSSVLQSIWCSNQDERHFAFNIAMKEMRMRDLSCKRNDIKTFKVIAHKLNVTGTPSIFLEDGRKISGFYTARDIITMLNKELAEKEGI